ncbi:MAG TPA: META domain-containing protein [Anaerolineales bacterium]|nr:META domain-containing protein [Anaerolineales bacterium]
MKKTILLTLSIIALAVAGCLPASAPDPAALIAAQSWLAEQLGVDIESVLLLNAEQVEWNDGCLELGGPDEGCLQAITPGWLIRLEVNGEVYELHTDEDGSQIRLAGDEASQFPIPAEAVLAAQAWMAERLAVNFDSVVLIEAEQVEWRDGCLELGRPDEGCLQAITSGWRLVFEVNGVTYTVHTDEDGSQIRLAGDELPSMGSPLLEGTSWALASFGLAGEESPETPVLEGTEVTLVFQVGGLAGGSGGCNSFGGNYSVTGDQIAFNQIAATEMACLGDGVMEQEQKYYEALGSAERFELSEGTLRIWYDGGAGVLTFTASE